MADKTKIEWTDTTWNPVRGCSKVSEGCRNCYAMGVAARFSDPGYPYEGLAKRMPSGPQWTNVVRTMPDKLEDPLHWRKPRRVFVNSMSDLFHPDVPFEFIDQVFAVMARARRHTFQILTKRPERMLEYFQTVHDRVLVPGCGTCSGSRSPFCDGISDCDHTVGYCATPWPLPNVWLGISVENQEAADLRMGFLTRIRAAVLWVSVEPMLGEIDFTRWMPAGRAIAACSGCGTFTSERNLGCKGYHQPEFECSGLACSHCGKKHYWSCSHVGNGKPNGQPLGWIVCGGESGTNARPMNPSWAESLRDQCTAAGVPFFFKQWGEWIQGRDLEDYRLGQFHGETVEVEQCSSPDQCTRITLCKAGKRVTGRILDGRTHDEYPEVVRA